MSLHCKGKYSTSHFCTHVPIQTTKLGLRGYLKVNRKRERNTRLGSLQSVCRSFYNLQCFYFSAIHAYTASSLAEGRRVWSISKVFWRKSVPSGVISLGMVGLAEPEPI